MSDFLSGMFLLGTLALAFFLIIIVLTITRLGKKRRYLNFIVFGIVYGLLSIWTVDRFVAGLYCLPWECVNRNIAIETLLLDSSDLAEGWDVKFTFDYAYIPRASSNYVERTYHNYLESLNNEFYQEIYQYRSVRGAFFQYTRLEEDFPKYYLLDNKSKSLPKNLQNNNATVYTLGYLYGSDSMCYYIAQYEEFVLVLEMPYSENSVPVNDFIEIIQMVDKKISKAIMTDAFHFDIIGRQDKKF